MAPETQAQTPPPFRLPPPVTSPADIRRLLREVTAIDESLLELGIRAGGTTVKMPKTSRLMEQTVQLNKLNLLKAPDRTALKQQLSLIQAKAPVLHMSFASDPSPVFIEKLMDWLRREIHPQALLSVGLQPNLGAGCVLRTANKYFDMSLRQSLYKQRDLLVSGLTAPPQAAVPQASGVAPAEVQA